MTISEYLIGHLVSCGMFEKDAMVVFAAVKAERHSTKDIKWNDQLDDPMGYPRQLIAVLLLIVRARAVEWVDENCPLAFYREVLLPSTLAK
ncbi:hypothetical protein LCGC14_1605010 [marine sediment metagenome]|uniref:Uncharacterized protein n=1 Tax=marine sediment metagenome TaxID=412755 RepID=A0A0F9LA01_9ZZZZ